MDDASCLLELQEELVAGFPRWVEGLSIADQILAIRPYFYDTSAPECYLNCSFIFKSTADHLLETKGTSRYFELWHCCQEIGDRWENFPPRNKGWEKLNQINVRCYELLCSDEDEYLPEYANAICRAAYRLNSLPAGDSGDAFRGAVVIPADGSGSSISDARAIQQSVPPAKLEELRATGYLDSQTEDFGIRYPDVEI